MRVCRCVDVGVGTLFECRIATAAAFNTDSSWLDERRNVMKLARRSDATRVCCDQDVLSKCRHGHGEGCVAFGCDGDDDGGGPRGALFWTDSRVKAPSSRLGYEKA